MRRTPALAFLLVTVGIDMLGLGLVVPIMPSLLIEMTGHADTAARWSGLIGAGYGAAQFLVAPALGRLADRYGRRPVLVLALTFLGIDYLAHAAAHAIWWLVAAHTLAGAFAGTGTVVNAYLADITEPDQRPRAYGLIGAAFSIGFVAGPAIGGLLGGVSVRLPFYVAAGLAFANATYGWLIVPESRRGDRRTSLGWRVSNPIASLVMMWRRDGLRQLTVARLYADTARIANQATWVFVIIARFGWSTTRVGLLLAVSSVVGAIVSARLSGPLVARLGERRAAIVCALAGVVSLAGYATVPSGWFLVAPMVLGSVAAIGPSALQSWIAGLAGADEQGTVQGALTGISSIAETVASIAATALFAWSLGLAWPGLVLLVAAVFALLSAFVLVRTPAPGVLAPALDG